jgi:prevent-host-death family protein
MVKVGIGELRDQVSRYIRRAEQGETIVVLNRDREVARIVPPRPRRRGGDTFVGHLQGTASIRGDLVSPAIAAEEWFRT